MRTGPKALVGLGLPAALRPHALSKGGGDILVTLDGKPIATLDYQTMGPAR